jgi:hypothetical protein
MADHDIVTLIRQAFNARDIDGALAAMDPGCRLGERVGGRPRPRQPRSPQEEDFHGRSSDVA